MKALLMHVAVDTSKKGTGGMNGPIFSNGTFEFIPIPEDYMNTRETRTYSTLKAKNPKYGKFLSDFVPSDIQDYLVHFDPDFENFTSMILKKNKNNKPPRNDFTHNLEITIVPTKGIPP